MTGQIIPPLILSSNYIVDGHARHVGLFPENLEATKRRIYSNLFITAPDLLEWVETQIVMPGIEQMISVEERALHPPTSYGWVRYSPSYPSISQGFQRAASAAYYARGNASERFNEPLLVTDLSLLLIDNNSLKDEYGSIVMTISENLSKEDAAAYAQLFAGSIDLLDIVDSRSSKDLADLKAEYAEAMEFNQSQGLATEYEISIPDDLQETRKLVARAKGVAYTDGTQLKKLSNP